MRIFAKSKKPVSQRVAVFFVIFALCFLGSRSHSQESPTPPASTTIKVSPAGSLSAPVDSPEVEIAIRQGKDLYAAGRFADSAEKFKTAITLGPDSEAAHYWLGKSMSAMGRLEEAVFHWEEVVAIRDALAARKAAAPKESIDALAKLSIRDAEARVAQAKKRLTYGLRFLEAGKWDQALAEFKAAKELDGSKSEYPEREGDVYMDKGLYGLAARSYAEAEARGGRDSWTYLKAAESLAAENRYREAIEVLRRGLKVNSGNAELSAGISKLSDAVESVPEVFAVVIGREGREVIIDKGSSGGVPFGREYRLKFDVVAPASPVVRPGSGEVVGRTGGAVKGELLLTRVEERMSYCLVTREGTQPVAMGDCVIISR